jgi:kinesin family protein 4/21/27
LQHKIKQEAEQFRQWKASQEKELLQVIHYPKEEEEEKKETTMLGYALLQNHFFNPSL